MAGISGGGLSPFEADRTSTDELKVDLSKSSSKSRAKKLACDSDKTSKATDSFKSIHWHKIANMLEIEILDKKNSFKELVETCREKNESIIHVFEECLKPGMMKGALSLENLPLIKKKELSKEEVIE
ncbi:MAG: hypothetical protein H0W88_12440 [Parachlamydiaceae bacterium]|nr:hypothetical protein [Parachlamydiaceae bacterium]